ncbi:MAG: hypothetical protein SWY16_25575 [Cyanobacteriota bacterium]|nr:hypothetical protein [Cyanobacteriota bacterium]
MFGIVTDGLGQLEEKDADDRAAISSSKMNTAIGVVKYDDAVV